MNWINVTDKKPEPLKRVLAVVKNKYGHLQTTIAAYVPYLTSDYCSENNEFTPEGWRELTAEGDYNYQLSVKVLWWMPIPEYPKEVEQVDE